MSQQQGAGKNDFSARNDQGQSKDIGGISLDQDKQGNAHLSSNENKFSDQNKDTHKGYDLNRQQPQQGNRQQQQENTGNIRKT